MTPKKYSERKREERESANSEVAGVILIIISAFFLLVMITGGFILGDIGRAISNVMLGVLGYFTFPLFVFLLILGIVKVQHRRIGVKAKYVVGTVVIALAVLLIAQLASSYAYIGEGGFPSYISSVYGNKNTVGGVIFGTVVYGIQRVVTQVVTYILLSLVILLSLFFMSGFYANLPFAQKYADKRKNSAKNKQSAIKSAPYNINNDFTVGNQSGGLFVGSIIKPDVKYSKSGNFEDIPDAREREVVQPVEQAEDIDVNRIYGREHAKKILFEQNTQAYEQFLPKKAQAQPDVRYEEKQSFPEVPVPPEKFFQHNFVDGEIVNGDEITAKLERDRVKPVETDAQENSGAETPVVVPRRPVEPVKKSDDIVSYTKISEKSDNKKSSQPYFNNAPIINGDYYVRGEEPTTVPDYVVPEENQSESVSNEVKTAQNERSEKPTTSANSSVFNSSTDYYEVEYEDDETVAEDTGNEIESKFTPEYDNLVDELENESLETNEEEFVPVFPIEEEAFEDVKENEPEEEQVIEEALESTVEEQPEETEKIETEKTFESDEDNDKVSVATETEQVDKESELSKKFEESTSSFNIVDEVEDLSEKSYSNPNDTTGYYNQVTTVPKAKPVEPKTSSFDKRVDEIDEKINNKPKQIDISEVAKAVADKAAADKPAPKPKPKKRAKYVAPPLDLLVTQSESPELSDSDTQAKSLILEETLEQFGVPAKVNGVTTGPAVTRYELDMPPGMSVKKIETLSSDIQYSLACKGQIRIESPIPGKRAVGIELPNDKIYTVALRDIIGSKEFKESSSPLAVALGKDIQGKVMLARLDKMPHLLIAGTTGSGKSSCLNSLLISILYKASPDDVKLILVDPKQVEFTAYNGIPHMMIPKAITDVKQAINAFKWAHDEMERRYTVLSQNQVRDIQEYNSMTAVKEGELPKMPYIVLIVDEFANLVADNANKRIIEDLIIVITAKARAAGIHLVLATQRPSVDVITGTIKANLPSRIAFAVQNANNSRIILDAMGAEALLGRGDMLFAPIGENDATRIQGAFVENFEVKNIVNFVKEHNQSDFDEEFEKAIVVKENNGNSDSDDGGDAGDGYDKELIDVVRTVIRSGMCSSSFIQRRFRFGFNKATRLVEQMEELGFIGPKSNSNKPREVIVTKEKFEEFFGEPYE